MYEKLKKLNLEWVQGRESQQSVWLRGEIKTKRERWILVVNKTLPIMGDVE